MRYSEFRESAYSTLLKGLIGSGPSGFSGFGFEPSTTDADSTKKTDIPGTDKNSDAEKVADVPSGLPVKGPVSSPFGRRSSGMHYGTDFAVPIGTPVVAPEDGTVWQAGWGGDAGNMVAINSGNVQHKLMHLSQVKVKPGEKVTKGQVVGLSGNTGYSTGPHLHWSKYVAGNPVDPMKNVG